MSTVFANSHALGGTPPSGFGGIASVTVALLVVLAAVFAVAWVARRMRGIGNRVGGAIDVLADVPLGPKERAVLLKIGTEQILLGVAPGAVRKLHVLPEPLEVGKRSTASAESTRPSFASILKKSLGR